MRPFSKTVIVIGLIILLGCVIALPQNEHIPIRQGTAQDFWSAATGVQEKPVIGGPRWCLSTPINGWFLYAYDHMHGSWFYRISADEAMANFPAGVEQLPGAEGFVPEWTRAGFRTWELDDPQHSDPQLLIFHLREAKLNWWNHESRSGRHYCATRDFELGVAWQRMEEYPLLRLVEWCYLSALILFAAWPWLRNGRPWSWAIHAALIPPLLLLPFYLGYCGWNYTSAGPGGGVVYPSILDACRWVPWNSLDLALIRHVPQVLARLTGPLGPMLSLSGSSHAGPIEITGLGLLLGSVVLLLRTRFCGSGNPQANKDRSCAP
jgi:hypothetical protein